MRNKDQLTIGDIYGDMLKQVKTITESKAPKTQKVGKPVKNAFNSPNPLKDGGPSEKGGFHKALDDKDCQEDEEDYGFGGKGISELKKKIKDEKDPKKKAKLQASLKNREKDAQTYPGDGKFVEESKKITRERLNTFMAKKSEFEKLYESVISENWMGGQEDDTQDVDALGLGDEPTDDELGDDFGGEEEGDEVTLTLSRELAKELLTLLQAVVGDDTEDALEGEDDGLDFGDDTETEDEDENYFDDQEDEETETIGAKDSKGGGETHKLQQKGNMKVQGKPQPKGSQSANAKVTDKVGTEYSVPAVKDGKQNKVSDIRQATDYFR